MFSFLPEVDMAYLYLIMVSIAAIIPVVLFIEAIFFFGALEAQFLSVAATFVACVSSAVAVVSEAAVIEVDNVLARFVMLSEYDNIVTKIFMRLLAVTLPPVFVLVFFLVFVPAAAPIIFRLAQKVLLACQYVVAALWHPVQDVLLGNDGSFEWFARRLRDLKNEFKHKNEQCNDLLKRYLANCGQCREVHAGLAIVCPRAAEQHTFPVFIPGPSMDTPKDIPEGTRPTIYETFFSSDRVNWRLQLLREKIAQYQECIAEVQARFIDLKRKESLSGATLEAMEQALRWKVRHSDDLPEFAHDNAAATTAPVPDVIVDDTVTATAVDAPTVTAGEEPIATEAVVESQGPADNRAEAATVELPIAVGGPDLASRRAEAGSEARLQDRRRRTSELPSDEEEMRARRSLWKARIRAQRRAERGPLPQEQDDQEEPIPACLQQDEVVHQEEVLAQEEASAEPDVSCTQQDNVEDEEEVDEEEIVRLYEEAFPEHEEEQDQAPSRGVQALPTEFEEGEGSRQIQSFQRHEAEEVSQQVTYDYQMAVYDSAEDQTSPTEAGRAQAASESTSMDLDESEPTTITEFASDGMQLDDEEACQDVFDPELMDIDVHVDNQTALDGAGPVVDAPEPMDVEMVDFAPTEEPERESPIEMDLDSQTDPDEARPDAGASEPIDVDTGKEPQLLPYVSVFNGVNLGSQPPQPTLNYQPAPVVAAGQGTAVPTEVQGQGYQPPPAQPAGRIFNFQAKVTEADDHFNDDGDAPCMFHTSYSARYNEDGTPRPEPSAGT